MVVVPERLDQILTADSLVARHVVIPIRAVAEIGVRWAGVPTPIGPIDTYIALCIARVTTINLECQLIHIEVPARLWIATLLARGRAVGAVERIDYDLEEVEEEVARSVASVHTVIDHSANR